MSPCPVEVVAMSGHPLRAISSVEGFSTSCALSHDALTLLNVIGHGGTIGFWFEKGVHFSGSAFGLDAGGILAEAFRQRFTYRDTIFRRHQKRQSVIGQESPGSVTLLKYFPFTTIRVLLGGSSGVDPGASAGGSGASAGGLDPDGASAGGREAPARRTSSVPAGINEDPLAGLDHRTRARASCLWVARGGAKLVLDGGGFLPIEPDTLIMFNHTLLTAPYIQLEKECIAAWAFLLAPENEEFHTSRRYLKAKERHAQWCETLSPVTYHCRVDKVDDNVDKVETETPLAKKGKAEQLPSGMTLPRRISTKTIQPPTLPAIGAVASEHFHWPSLFHRFIIGDTNDEMVAAYEWQLDTAELGGMDQIIWAMVAPTDQRLRDRYQFAPLKYLLPDEEMTYLLDNNVPAQMVKDIVAMRALQLYGGLAVDLKIASVGQAFPEADEFPEAAEFPVVDLGKCWVFTEPVKITSARCTNRKMPLPHFDGGTTHGQVWLGVIGGPAAHTMFFHLERAFHTFWKKWADDVNSGARQRVNWSAMRYNEHWMENTRAAHAAATNTFVNAVQILPPLAACPLPPWMSSLDQLGQKPYGYQIPTAAQLQKEPRCRLVCVWQRQWKEETKQALKQFLGHWLAQSENVLSHHELARCQYYIQEKWQNSLESYVFLSLATHKISFTRAYFYALTREKVLSRHVSQVAAWSSTPWDFILYGAAVVALAAGWPTSISHAESLVKKACLYTGVAVPTQEEADSLLRLHVAVFKRQ